MYGVTRIPGLPTDSLVHSPHPHPTPFITVIVNDHFYKLPVVDLTNHSLIDPKTLEANLWSIVEDAVSRPRGAGVGACSGDSRDTWTNAREHLLALDPQNRTTITAIEDSLFILSLDDSTQKSETYLSSSPTTDSPDLEAHILSASTAGGTGRNRWWDKAISIHVESNARASMVGEHSPCDALIPSIVADFVLSEGVNSEDVVSRKGLGVEPVQRLEWVLDQKAEKSIEDAVETVKEIAKDSEGRMLWYDEYGVEWIKKAGTSDPIEMRSCAQDS